MGKITTALEERKKIVRWLVKQGYAYTAEKVAEGRHTWPECPDCSVSLAPVEVLQGACPVCKTTISSSDFEPDGLDLCKAEREADDASM